MFHGTFTPDQLPLHLNEARVLEDEWIFSSVRHDRLSGESTVSLFDPISRGTLLLRQTVNLVDQDVEWQDSTLPIEGDYIDLVIGLLLGFLFGLIVLPFLYEKKFSIRQQMGIVAGLLVNIIFGIIKLSY